jgi:AcrR family transcriptional regulator
MPAKRADKKEATRQRILAAAMALFEKKGYDATTTKAIAVRAKVAEGTVFNYFPTKDDIALFFFEREVDHAIARVREKKSLRNAPLEEKLFALIQFQLEYLAPYQSFIGAAFLQALRPASKLAVSAQAILLRQRYLNFVQDLMKESFPDGSANLALFAAPHAFWLYYLGILLYWLNDQSAGKQRTLAFLDLTLRTGVGFLNKATVT